jgi:hypothetical protein
MSSRVRQRRPRYHKHDPASRKMNRDNRRDGQGRTHHSGLSKPPRPGDVGATPGRLAGVRPLILETAATAPRHPKAYGLAGQTLQLLRYRGLLERFEATSTDPRPVPASRSAVYIWTSHTYRSPLKGLPLPQHRLERVLDEIARERGAGSVADTRWSAEPGQRRGDRGRTPAGRAASGDRSIPRRLRRRAQPGARPGRHPVPRHHVSRGSAVRRDRGRVAHPCGNSTPPPDRSAYRACPPDPNPPCVRAPGVTSNRRWNPAPGSA